MKKAIYILFIAIILSCSTKQEKQVVKVTNNDCYYKVDVEKWRNEILPIDSMIISKQLKYVDEIDNVLSTFGKPDFINKVSNRSGYLQYVNYDSLSKAKEYLYGLTSFYCIGNKSIVKTIDFISTEIEIDFPQITLKKGLFVGEICELFPESCKLILMSGNTWSGHIELRASKYSLDPRRIFLTFRNERLERVSIITFSRR